MSLFNSTFSDLLPAARLPQTKGHRQVTGALLRAVLHAPALPAGGPVTVTSDLASDCVNSFLTDGGSRPLHEAKHDLGCNRASALKGNDPTLCRPRTAVFLAALDDSGSGLHGLSAGISL